MGEEETKKKDLTKTGKVFLALSIFFLASASTHHLIYFCSATKKHHQRIRRRRCAIKRTYPKQSFIFSSKGFSSLPSLPSSHVCTYHSLWRINSLKTRTKLIRIKNKSKRKKQLSLRSKRKQQQQAARNAKQAPPLLRPPLPKRQVKNKDIL